MLTDWVEGDWRGGEVGKARSWVVVGVRSVFGMEGMEWRERCEIERAWGWLSLTNNERARPP